MKSNLDERALDIASYIIENNASISKTAKYFGISKSTVHKDINERLKTLDEDKYNEVLQIQEIKKMQRILIKGYSPEEDLVASPPLIRKPTK